MPERIIQMFLDNVNDYHTPLGKTGLVIDMIAVVFTMSHFIGLGKYINEIFTPIGVVLTVVFVSLRIVFTCASEYRSWKKRNNK